MRSVEELDLIKQKALDDMKVSGSNSVRKVLVGMATCGMAAGAGKVMEAIENELNVRNVRNVCVSQTGCIGVCRLEPIIEVYETDGSRTTYVKLDPDKSRKIVIEHLINGQICKDLTIGAFEK